MLKLCCTLALALAALSGTVHAQTTWYVDAANCPGPGSGTLGDPCCSIQDGINAAINLLGKAITLRSSDGPDVTTIDAQGSGNVVTCTSFEGHADQWQDRVAVCHYLVNCRERKPGREKYHV